MILVICHTIFDLLLIIIGMVILGAHYSDWRCWKDVIISLFAITLTVYGFFRLIVLFQIFGIFL